MYLMLLLKMKMTIYNITDYLPFPIDLIIFIFMLSGLIPFNGILYFILSTVSGTYPADTVISIEGQDGGSLEPNMSTSCLYNTCKITC